MFTLNCKGKLLVIDSPLVMGIVNITPDSFYSGNRFSTPGEVLFQVEKMIKEGADFIDIGGQSSRPGSKRVGIDEELTRIIDIIASIHTNFPDLLISADTFYAEVARQAVAAGASIINDISGGNFDSEMLTAVAALKVPYVCMHLKGTPQTMQNQPQYEDVTREVLDFFVEKAAMCKKAGVTDLIIDPGFGFGKNRDHNFALLKNLSLFSMLGHPLLIGVSRKSTIFKTLGVTAEEALNGTTVLQTIGLLNGASILRTHDVKEAKEAVRLFMAYSKN
jgi:dihydropteroate synthase